MGLLQGVVTVFSLGKKCLTPARRGCYLSGPLWETCFLTGMQTVAVDLGVGLRNKTVNKTKKAHWHALSSLFFIFPGCRICTLGNIITSLSPFKWRTIQKWPISRRKTNLASSHLLGDVWDYTQSRCQQTRMCPAAIMCVCCLKMGIAFTMEPILKTQCIK